jgi:hypothetical protein
MHQRVREEIELLRQQFLGLQHGDQFDWVLIPELALPVGRFNKAKTRLLFRIPTAYPQTGPDNFFVDVDLRLKDGSNPPAFNANANSSSGVAPVAADWGWFSWHPKEWRPAATIEGGDNLLGFIRGINLCLRGEESA